MKVRHSITLIIATLIVSVSASEASSSEYKNQKAGQFCKNIDLKKVVKISSGNTLVCAKDPKGKARWTARP
jgi:hypothetical protein